jgi:hypothetical protein
VGINRGFMESRLTSRRGNGTIPLRQCPGTSGTFLDEAIRPLKVIVALHSGGNHIVDASLATTAKSRRSCG